MSSSPLSGVLSPAQIAIIQQARALVARPQTQAAQPARSEPSASPAQPSQAASPVRGRGQIVNITV